MAVPTYRANAIPTCACGARLLDLPEPEPQSRPTEALRHLAISLATPKNDPLLARALTCRACGGLARVDEFREHIEDLPIGRSYRHICTSCNARFATETLWASLSRSLAAVLALAGVAILAQRIQRIRNRWFKRRPPRLRGP